MGGGDLNTKKTWHPSTLKNQERVWKAEQAAAEEKKRILELQRERAQERDREELNELNRQNTSFASGSNDSRLHWMYDKPDKKVQQEDYLLGKVIDKNYDQTNKSENEIPAVSRRVVGSSMLTSGCDVQVDLARKLREDPLLMVKERERAARAALLNNPVQRRRLAELLRKEQEQNNVHKTEKKSKKKGRDLDDLLAAKLNALSGDKGMNIAKLLESDDSSSDSSSDEKSKKKKKKKKKSKKKSKGDSSDALHKKKKVKYSEKSDYNKSNSEHVAKRKSTNDDTDEEYYRKKSRRENSPIKKRSVRDNEKHPRDSSKDKYFEKNRTNYHNRTSKDSHNSGKRGSLTPEGKDSHNSGKRGSLTAEGKDSHNSGKRATLTAEEKAAKLAEMAAAGMEREVQRSKRVAEQRRENATEKVLPKYSSRNEARMLPDSLESRIHSNRHYIQRGQRHMNENFARR